MLGLRPMPRSCRASVLQATSLPLLTVFVGNHVELRGACWTQHMLERAEGRRGGLMHRRCSRATAEVRPPVKV